MRNTIIGLIVGAVLGVILGATVIAPRLDRDGAGVRNAEQAPPPTAAEMVKQMPRALVAQPDVSMRMASSFPLDTPIAGALARRIDSRIWEMSHGKIEIRPYALAANGPATHFVKAVGSGAIDAAFTTPSVDSSKSQRCKSSMEFRSARAPRSSWRGWISAAVANFSIRSIMRGTCTA